MKLYELEPQAARPQEDRVRPGLPYQIAAHKTAPFFGLHLSEKQSGKGRECSSITGWG